MQKIIIITILFCAGLLNLFAAPQMSPTSIKIMREIKMQYKTEKLQMYLTAYLQDKNLTNEQLEQVREKMNYFFDSDTFTETGAAYLTALFTENDLREVLRALENGTFFNNGAGRSRNVTPQSSAIANKLQKLFEKLDPYLYRYLEQNIIGRP